MAIEQMDSGGPGQKAFYQVWLDAVTKPNVENYKEIVDDPKATFAIAFLWLAGAGFVSSLISGILGMIFGSGGFAGQILGDDYASSPTFFGVVGGAVASLFIVPLVVLIMVGLVQLVSKMLGGDRQLRKAFLFLFGLLGADQPG